MNRTPDVERVLREYLADDGGAAPDYVLDLVSERIGRQRQRRAWPFSGRTRSMNPLKLGAALAAVAIMAVIGYSVLPRLSSIGGPSTTATIEPTPTSRQPASAPAIDCEDDIPGCAGVLGAGDHLSAHFSPTFGYRIATPGQWENTIDTEGLFALLPDDSVYQTPADLIMVWSDVAPAERPASCGLQLKPGASHDEAGWITYLTNHPGLVTSNLRPVNLNGSTGQMVDLEINYRWTPDCEADRPTRDVPLIKSMGDQGLGDGYGVRDGIRVRFLAITVGNQTVVITIHVYGSPTPGDYAAATEAAQRVIDTFDWACDADSPPGPCWGPPDPSGNPATPPPAK